ncbi:MAG: sigma-54 dependent transcriptional regulator [Bacteroidales bacterium]|nr:sigma-54 dependent transcriptional regulator [Bacteroidales bacterium]
MKASILIIDDDPYIITLLENYFNREGYQIYTSYKGKPALKILHNEKIDVVLCDIRLPDFEGTELLRHILKLSPDTVVIMMTAYAEIRTAVESMKAGAFEYVTKPILPDEISDIVRRAVNKNIGKGVKPAEDFITGSSTKMLEVIDQAKLVAPTDMSVLIQGETGSGKEYIARLIHKSSMRKGKNFVAIDCGAIPRELASSELFGHIKGAFTGAISDKSGYFEQANGGTIFLDEIGNLTYETQVKLLRAIQQKVITRVGDSKEIKVDVRIISATNSDMLKAIGDGHFREDLYHRINEFKIELPPLRERGNDIMTFAHHFLAEANQNLNKNIQGFDNSVTDAFMSYAWHGNLREMRNVVKRSVLVTRSDYITINALPQELKCDNFKETEHKTPTGNSLSLKDAAEVAEKGVVEKALAEANFNKSLAAKILKIDRKTLYNKIERYGIKL